MRVPLPLLAFIRGSLAFFILLLLTHLMGKKQLSQLTFFDYIIGITIGSIAASLTTDLQVEAAVHWVGLLTWTFWEMVLSVIIVHSRPMRKLIDGEPTVVIHNGKILENNLELLALSLDDLRTQLRQQGVFGISEVEFAILETNGGLSVLRKSQHQPATPKDLGIETRYKGIPVELIVDGHVIEPNLRQVNLSTKWLHDQLRERGCRLDQVYYAELDTDGSLYIDLRNDMDRKTVVQDMSE